jgi:hypothetical protein
VAAGVIHVQTEHGFIRETIASRHSPATAKQARAMPANSVSEGARD